MCSNAKEKKTLELNWSIEKVHFDPRDAIHILMPAENPKLSFILKGGQRYI